MGASTEEPMGLEVAADLHDGRSGEGTEMRIEGSRVLALKT